MAAATAAAPKSLSGGSALVQSEELPSGDILQGLDGRLLTRDDFTKVLRNSGELDDGSQVLSVEVVAGSELRWPQSHSAKLRLAVGPAGPDSEQCTQVGELLLYLKKVIGSGLPPKPLHSLRRDLLSNKNEARFYKEFAPTLIKRGLPLLRVVLVDDTIIVPEELGSTPQEEERVLRQGGMLMLMESADGYWQASPLSAEWARESLHLLARLHTAAWQDTDMLSRVADRLHRLGGYWTLDKRGIDEMRSMHEHWEQYTSSFHDLNPELFSRPGIVELAQRVERVAPAVAAALAPEPGDAFATLIHGDYKAMNIFLEDKEGQPLDSSVPAKRRRRWGSADAAVGGMPATLPIDFQWTGVGFGMSDVAMHLCHSVAVDALRGQGERDLVEMYRSALVEAVGASANAYTPEIAWRHYCLGVVDYARMVLGCFFKDASPQAFAARAGKENVGLAYRSAEASFLFVERVDRCLRVIEGE